MTEKLTMSMFANSNDYYKAVIKEQKKVLDLLAKALKDSNAHLDYCGWGDRYERECADLEKLPEQNEAALKAYDKLKGDDN